MLEKQVVARLSVASRGAVVHRSFAGFTDCSGVIVHARCLQTVTLIMEFIDEYAGRSFVRACAHSYRNI